MTSQNTIDDKQVVQRLLDADKLKYCYECGICTASCPSAELFGEDYNPRELVEKIVLGPEQLTKSEGVWLCSWCYRCYKRCNQGIKLPEVFLAVRKMALQTGRPEAMQKAFEKIAETVPLPLVSTLACFHPERAGTDLNETLTRIGQMREEFLKREKARRAQEVAEEKVAIVGSGPAGLTVAYYLSRKGYGVTMFETLPEAGGMLRKCLPDFRLPRQFVDIEIETITSLGVELKTGVTVGQDVSFGNLSREGFKAVFIGTGAHRSLDIRIEGSDLKGVENAVEFLWNANCGKDCQVGQTLVVIGGGNVAIDVARMALRKGAKNVMILYRRSRDEMPAIPWEVDEAEKEGVKVQFLVAPKKIIGENGKVTSLECLRTELGEPDESGRRRASVVAGSEFMQDCGGVVLAIGEAPGLSFLPKEIELNDDGTVWVNPETMQTSLKGVFAGGDCVTGAATVIEAIVAGKRASEGIDRFLRESRGGS